MVFSSFPIFLDPSNWQQRPNDQQGNGNFINSHEVLHQHQQLPPFPPQDPSPSHHEGSSRGGSAARHGGSMAERARLTNIPRPGEGALKCPRCESTNTKFCYFNNYNLCQPRHFCKTCRRYWTRGGALRNVPFGGGCRRKKKKGNPVISPKGQNRQSNNNTTSGTQHQFLASPQNLLRFSNLGLNLNVINYDNQANNTISLINDPGFLQVGSENIFDPAMGSNPFQSEGNITSSSSSSSSSASSMAARVSDQRASAKLEDYHLLDLLRPISGLTSSENNNQIWLGASDFSGLKSASFE